MNFDELGIELDVTVESSRIKGLVKDYIKSKESYTILFDDIKRLEDELKEKKKNLNDCRYGNIKHSKYYLLNRSQRKSVRILINRRINKINELLPKYKLELEMAKINYSNCNYKLDYHLNNMSKKMLLKVINYLDFDLDLNQDKKDLVDEFKKNLIEDIELIRNNRLDIRITPKYHGRLTFINTLIERKKVFEAMVKEINHLLEEIEKVNLDKDNLENIIKEVTLEKEGYEKHLIKKIIHTKDIAKLEEFISSKRENIDCILINKSGFVYDLKKIKVELIVKYDEYKKIYNILDVVLNNMSKKQLKDVCNKLNIVISIPDTLYFDEDKAMKDEIFKYFNIQEVENAVKDSEQQKVK